MQIYHASGQIVECPAIIKTKYNKDFSWGFYCTNDISQAERWARRNKVYGGTPTINIYEYTRIDHLEVQHFDEMTEEWLDFITTCRAGQTHSYDIVEGPMADDEIWNFVENFISGKINRDAFWALAKFRHPTHQISFHTIKALNCLTFIEAKEVE